MLARLQYYIVIFDYDNDDMTTNETIMNFYLVTYCDSIFYKDVVTNGWCVQVIDDEI